MGVLRPRLCLILCNLKRNVYQQVYDIICMSYSRNYTGDQSARPHAAESFTKD